MMSVNEFFYGNQPTPTHIVRTSAPTPAKHQQQHQQHGSRSVFSHDSSFSRDDHNAVQGYNRNYSNPSDHDSPYNRNYSNYSNLDSYSSRYPDSQVLLDSRYPSSAFVSPSTRQYDNNSSASLSLNQRLPQLSKEFSSPGYSRYSGRGNSKPVSTWVELRVPICCEGCEERVTSHLLELRGVESVTCDQRKQRVLVRGTAVAGEVLRVCKKLFKKSEFWQYQYDWS